MFCNQCGQPYPDGASYCSSCGSALPPAPSVTVPPIPSQAPAQAGVGTTQNASSFAGFWIRVAAHMVDGWVISGCALVGALACAALARLSGHEFGDGFLIGWCVASVGSLIYYPVLESSQRQGTIGKRLVGLIVTDTRGQRISLGRAIGRLLGKLLNGFTIGIGYLMVGLTAQKRGLHDFVAGTLVMKAAIPPRTATARAIVIVGVGSALLIPFMGIVAAIAVPGFLRARMAGNEASAIGALRAITTAQIAHHAACGGFAPDLPSLSRPEQFLDGDLTAARAVTHDGYTVTLARHPDATDVSTEIAGCEGSVNAYVATAVPVTPGTSGERHFAATPDGAIVWDLDGTFANPQPLTEKSRPRGRAQ